MLKQDKGLKRDTKDKYYTCNKVVNDCIKTIENNIKISKNDLCIEPSAGNGAFIEMIKQKFENYKFYDLEPEHEEIVKQDYLKLNIDEICKSENKKIHVIGNPPFGRQSSLAIKFIKKSCEYCESISFILPKSFKKDSMKKHFPLNFHMLYECDLPENSFLVDDVMHDVPCIFQIWEKKTVKRSTPKKLTPKGFKFVGKKDNPDISFRRVGVKAGNISNEIENKSEQSHYFIKFDEKPSNVLLEKISNIDFDCKNNTVGPKSISKQELIKEFIVIFSGDFTIGI